MTNSSIPADTAAARMLRREARDDVSGMPYEILCAMLAEKRTGVCGTIAISERKVRR